MKPSRRPSRKLEAKPTQSCIHAMATRGGQRAVSAWAAWAVRAAPSSPPLGQPCRVLSSTGALRRLSRVQTTCPGTGHVPLPQDLPGSSPHTLPQFPSHTSTASGDIFAANVLSTVLSASDCFLNWFMAPWSHWAHAAQSGHAGEASLSAPEVCLSDL